MKPISILLTASLAGSAVLAALLLSSPITTSLSASATSKPIAPNKTAPTASTDPTAGIDPKFWSTVGSGDLATQVAQLRAAGFPPAIVRALIAAQIQESFAARRKALTPSGNPAEFWKNPPLADPKTRAALQSLSREQSQLLTDLLGPNPPSSGINSIYERRQYAGVPPAKLEQFTRVMRDYNEMQSEALAGFVGGSLSPDDSARLALLEKEQRADIARLLTPQELEDYELRTSNTASQMRYSLNAFKPTESEFRAIFQQQREFDEKYRTTSAAQASNQEFMRQRQEAQKQLTDQIKASLGQERAADYERATDYSFQAVYRVVDRLGLPAIAASDAYALQKDIQQRAQALQTNRQLTPDARNPELAALNSEATAKLTTALGQRGFDVYKQNGGAGWLQILQPRPVLPAGARGGAGAPPAAAGGGRGAVIRVIGN